MRRQSRYLFIYGAMGLLVLGLQAQAQSSKKGSSKVDMSNLDNPKVDTSKLENPKGDSSKPGAAAADGAKKTDDQKVDISDLENRYWAPKDTDFTVVQNRTFTKEKRVALALQAGRLINDGYSEGFTYGLTGNYYFSERYGIEVTYMQADLKNNEPTRKLREFGTGVQPDFGRVTNFYGVGFNYVPFYAKMSFLGQKILYFDMAVTPQIGMMGYEQVTESGSVKQSAFAYGINFTQYFFFTKNLSLRVDLQNLFFKEDVAKFRSTGGVPEGQTFRNKDTQMTQFILGLNIFF